MCFCGIASVPQRGLVSCPYLKTFLSLPPTPFPALPLSPAQMYVYATSLIMIGVGAKVLLKKASNEAIFYEANWVLAVALLVAFLCLNVFSFLHNQKVVRKIVYTRGNNLTWVHIRQLVLALLSALSFISIALAEMRPARTLVSGSLSDCHGACTSP